MTGAGAVRSQSDRRLRDLVTGSQRPRRDDVDRDAEEPFQLVRGIREVEQVEIRCRVDEEVDVAARLVGSCGDRPGHARIGHAVAAQGVDDLGAVRPE